MTLQVVQLQSAGRWPTDLEVWHLAMPSSDNDIDEGTLSVPERERATWYRRPADRIRYMATRVILRELLGVRLGVKPASLRFTVTQRGRPELTGIEGRLSFNVSHSGDHALIAISAVWTVGVDIEYVDPMVDWRQLLSVVCTDEEQQILMTDEADCLQLERFFRCWTAKEAVLKAMGLGIAENLRDLFVSPTGEGVQRPIVGKAASIAAAAALRYHSLADVSRYMGCVAFYGPASG